MDLTTKDQQDGWNALGRLLRIARQDTGQARRVAGFLLAWHNAEENGGWDPTDLWNVDAAMADDMLTAVPLIRDSRRLHQRGFPLDLVPSVHVGPMVKEHLKDYRRLSWIRS